MSSSCNYPISWHDGNQHVDNQKDHIPNYLRPPRPSKGQGVTHLLSQTSREQWRHMKPSYEEPKRSSIHEDYFPSMKALTAVTEKRLGRYLLVSSPPIYQRLTPSQVKRRPWKLSPDTQYQDEIFLSESRRTTVLTFCTFQENSDEPAKNG